MYHYSSRYYSLFSWIYFYLQIICWHHKGIQLKVWHSMFLTIASKLISFNHILELIFVNWSTACSLALDNQKSFHSSRLQEHNKNLNRNPSVSWFLINAFCNLATKNRYVIPKDNAISWNLSRRYVNSGIACLYYQSLFSFIFNFFLLFLSLVLYYFIGKKIAGLLFDSLWKTSDYWFYHEMNSAILRIIFV